MGLAFDFTGGGQSVVIPDSPSLELTNTFTIEAWVNLATLTIDPNGPGRGIVSKMGGAGGNNGYQFLFGQNTLIGQFNSPGQGWPQWAVSATVPALAAGVWMHVAWTYDEQAMMLYVNGEPVATNVIGPQAIATSASNLRISGDDNGNVMFDGLIDEVSIYTNALSAAQIQAIYAAGSAGMCKPAAPTVIATGPDYGALGLPTNTALLATFSEPMDVTTLTTNTVFVNDAQGNLVPGNVVYSQANRTATSQPLAGMPNGTNTLTVTTGAKDLNGNPLAANFTWSFRVNVGATMLTSNTLIDTGNTNFDGLDLIVSNCTVSLNGSHSLDGVLVMNSGALDIAGDTTLDVTRDFMV